MAKFLLIDYGATRIKAAIFNSENGVFTNKKDFLPLSNCVREAGHYEVSLFGIRKQFLQICKSYYKTAKFSGILISSEMHGFALLDENDKPLTNYISWKDERSLEKIDSDSTFESLKNKLGVDFRAITGMKSRPGLPFFNAVHLAGKAKLKSAKMITLPDLLAMCSDDSRGRSHDTMMAGLGFYDINNRRISERLLALAFDKAGVKFTFNELAETGAIAGYLHVGKRKIPIYVGVGDHQCAILGAGNVPGKTLSINIGTGSQVSTIADEYAMSEQFDVRPYFENKFLKTITHIPAGRALNIHLDFLNSFGKKNYWDILGKITDSDVDKADLKFDLAFFGSAWNYNGGGKIFGITENNLNVKNYLASIVKAMAESYLAAAKIIDVDNKLKIIVMSGGIPRKIPALAHRIAKSSGRKIIIAEDIDETLIGLGKLASKF